LKDGILRRRARLGVVLALVLGAVALVFVGAVEVGKEKPGDIWFDLKSKEGKELKRLLETELREMTQRMEAFERQMDEMMERMRGMERGVPERWWSPPRPREWRDQRDLDEWLKEFEKEWPREFERRFRFGPDEEPFQFDLRMKPGEKLFMLRMDTKETDEAYVLTLDVPGMDKDDITVELVENVLTVSGEREEQVEDEEREGQQVRREISYGRFERRITLPDNADTEQITSTYEDGVLTITVPKKEQAEEKSRRIIIHHP